MHIRRIRINRFGCWEELDIPALEASLNVIHLDDGGRPVDFARFLAGMLFAFDDDERNVDGRLDIGNSPPYFSLGRCITHDGRRRWELSQRGKSIVNPDKVLRRIQGQSDPILVRRLLFSDGLFAERWKWMGRNPDVIRWLLGGNLEGLESLTSMSQLSVSAHGRIIQELGERRDRLVHEIAKRQVDPPPAQAAAPKPIPQEVVVAELSDELRLLKRKLAALQTAHQLADKWQELQRLEGLKPPARDVDQLRSLLSEYRDLNQEARDWERQLEQAMARPQVRKSTEHTDHEFEIRQLLDREDWVRKVARQTASQEVAVEASPDIRCGNEVLRTARLRQAAEKAYADRQQSLGSCLRLGPQWEGGAASVEQAEPALQGDPRWSPETPHSSLSAARGERGQMNLPIALDCRSELDDDEPIAQESAENKLAELKRRRLWVSQERSCLVRRRQPSSSMLLALALLFSLSIAALFGVLLIATPAFQWALTSLGLSGIVASGAIQLSYQRRAARLLGRATKRLCRIDREIEVLSLELVGSMPTAQRRAGLHTQTTRQLQLDADEARQRLARADDRFRKALADAGLPRTLTPTEATRAIATSVKRGGKDRPDHERRSKGTPARRLGTAKNARPTSCDSNSLGDPKPARQRPNVSKRKLRRWVKQARSLIYALDGDRPTEDPIELIGRLDETYQRLREQSRKGMARSPSDSRDEVKRARRKLKRIESRQQEILHLANVDDDHALSTELQAAEQAAEGTRRAKSLSRQLDLKIECHEDAAEVRELLTRFSASDLSARHAAATQQIADLEAEIQCQQSVRPSTRVREISESERAVERLRLELGVVETRLRQAINTGQVGMVVRRTASEVLQRRGGKVAAMSYLPRMTKWDSIDFESGRVVLQNANERVLPDDVAGDSRLAWLALQLEAASKLRRDGRALPLVLLADEIGSSDADSRVLEVLQEVAGAGQQILVLTGRVSGVHQWTNAGVPIVRVGLREESAAFPMEPNESVLLPAA